MFTVLGPLCNRLWWSD